jgi:hypothetical protein
MIATNVSIASCIADIKNGECFRIMTVHQRDAGTAALPRNAASTTRAGSVIVWW